MMMCEECNGCKNGLMDAGVCYMDLVNELTERAEEEGIELDDEEDIKQCSDCKDGEHENYDDDVNCSDNNNTGPYSVNHGKLTGI